MHRKQWIFDMDGTLTDTDIDELAEYLKKLKKERK